MEIGAANLLWRLDAYGPCSLVPGSKTGAAFTGLAEQKSLFRYMGWCNLRPELS